MALDEHYICQRAANAIISEVGPYRVSTDALQAINQFLDEFIVLLLACSLSLDLSNIKAVVFNLLPSTLGKNAVVEAELEVKTFLTETTDESIDYDVYERMRSLRDNAFPLDEAVPLLREKCFEYCTLADKEDQLYMQRSKQQRKQKVSSLMEPKVIISPIVAIYVTTIMEHIGEYLLTAVAMSAEHEDTDYIRVKEVFLALIDDIQLGNVFHKMDLREKLEKRAGVCNGSVRQPNNLSASSSCRSMDQQKNAYSIHQPTYHEKDFLLDLSFDDDNLDMDYFGEEKQRKSTYSTNSVKLSRPASPSFFPPRPYSSLSNHSSANSSTRKSTFHLFKDQRNTLQTNVVPRVSSTTSVPFNSYSSVQDNENEEYTSATPPLLDFDELIRSGETVKVSLTPNRLRSIEVKDQTKEDVPPPPKWERRSTVSTAAVAAAAAAASPRLSVANNSRPSSPLSQQQKYHHLPNENSTTAISNLSSTLSSLSSLSSSSSLSTPSLTMETGQHDSADARSAIPQLPNVTIEVPKLSTARCQHTPSSPLSKQSFTMNRSEEHLKVNNSSHKSHSPYTSNTNFNTTIHVAPKNNNNTATQSITETSISKQTATISPASSFDSNNKKLTPLSKLPSLPISTEKASSNSINGKPDSKNTVSTSSSTIINTDKDISSNNTTSCSSMALQPILSSAPLQQQKQQQQQTSFTSTTATTVITIQEPIIKPRLSKSSSSSNMSKGTPSTINAKGLLLRRSSGSSRKSRENLKRLKEEQEGQQQQVNNVESTETKKLADITAIEDQQQQQQQQQEVEEEKAISIDKQPSIDNVLSQQEEYEVKKSDEVLTEEPQSMIKEIDQSKAERQQDDQVRKADKEKEEARLDSCSVPSVTVSLPTRRMNTTLSLERPSSLVAKRASMVGNSRRRSMHESFATEKYHTPSTIINTSPQQKDMNRILRQRQSSVSMSIKQWDDISKTGGEEQAPQQQQQQLASSSSTAMTKTQQRRSVLRQLRQIQQQQNSSPDADNDGNNSSTTSNSAVLDKVLKFERASSLEHYNNYMPRRERFLYLQQDPSIIERKTLQNLTAKKKVKIGIDQAVQTDSPKKKEEEQHGQIEGDEEWFIEDSVWDEQEEITIVEWLLGE